MADAFKERRAAPRYPLILIAEVTDRLSSAKFTARTSDVSRSGCYLDMLNPLPRGTQIHVHMQSEKEKFEWSGTVIYLALVWAWAWHSRPVCRLTNKRFWTAG